MHPVIPTYNFIDETMIFQKSAVRSLLSKGSGWRQSSSPFRAFHSSKSLQVKRWWGTDWIIEETKIESLENTKILALGPTWLIINNNGHSRWGSGIPTKGLDDRLRLDDRLPGRQVVLSHPNVVTMGPSGSDQYFVQFEDGSQQWNNLDDFLEAELRRMFGEPNDKDRHQVKSLALGPNNGYYSVWANGRCCWNNLPDTLQKSLNGSEKRSVLPVEYISMGP